MRKRLSLGLAVVAGTLIAVSTYAAAEQSGTLTPKGTGSAITAASSSPSGTPVGKNAPNAGVQTDWLAQREALDAKPSAPDEPSTPVTVASFLLKLALVLGLCYATMLGLRRFTSVKNAVGASRGRIRVVENSTLGANRTLHLIEIGSKRLLVASTPNQVNLLTELDPGDVTEPAPEQPRASFKEQLALFMGNKADASKSARTVAQMIRDSSSHIQDRVREVGSMRRNLRDAESR